MSTMATSDLQLCCAVIEQAPDALIFADHDGTIELSNARAEIIFGYAAGEVIGRSLDLIIPEDLRAAHWRGYHQAIALGHANSAGQALATRATHKLGSKLYVELAFGIICDPDKRVLGAVATGRDITQRYLAERAPRAR